jgi:hypothetical protein
MRYCRPIGINPHARPNRRPRQAFLLLRLQMLLHVVLDPKDRRHRRVLRVAVVEAVLCGEEASDARLDGGFDEFVLGVFLRFGAHGGDQDVLALEGFNECCVGEVVRDASDGDVGGKGGFGGLAG